MKVLMVLPYLKIGGTETQASYISKHLKKKGFEVLVVVFDDKYQNSKFEGLTIQGLGLKFRWYNYIFILIRLSIVIKRFNPDYIISRSWNGNIFTGITGILHKKPYMLFISNSMYKTSFNKIKKILHKYILKCSNRIISVSEKSKFNLLDSFPILKNTSVSVINNGVYINSTIKDGGEYKYDNDKVNLVFVGRLNYRKGLDIILKSITNLDDSLKNIIKLYVIGDGPKLEDYKSYVKENDIEDVVYFELKQENPFKYLIGADIFVMASRAEGFPNVLVEAMSCSLPCISTDCKTGPNEIIVNMENGILVPVDNVEDMTKSIKYYISNPEIRKIHGSRALKTIMNRFDANDKMNDIESYIISKL